MVLAQAYMLVLFWCCFGAVLMLVLVLAYAKFLFMAYTCLKIGYSFFLFANSLY
jgi:hypothetical protein